MSAEEEIEAFRAILRTKPTLAALAGSEFESLITSYIGNRGDANIMAGERQLQESFLSTALNRESILAKGEDDGYVPTLPSPFKQYLSIKNNGVNPVILALRQAFVTDDQVQMVIDESITIAAGGTEIVAASQLEKEVKSFVGTGGSFEEFILGGMDGENNLTIHEFTISVDGTDWSDSQYFKNADETSEVYLTFYRLSDEIAIRFGNGDSGKIPDVGADIEATIWHTKGDSASIIEGQELRQVGTILDTELEIADLEIVTGTVIELGSALEDIESIRKSVKSHIQIGDVVARSTDYEFMIKKQFTDLVYLKCWGEQEMAAEYGANLDYINKLFYSFLIENEAETAAKAVEIDDFVNTLVKPMNVIPENITINQSSFQIEVTGEVDRQFIISDVEAAVEQALLDVYGKYKNIFSRIKPSEIYDIIDQLGYFRDTQPHLKRTNRPFFEISIVGDTEISFYDDYVYLSAVTFSDGAGGTNLAYVTT